MTCTLFQPVVKERMHNKRGPTEAQHGLTFKCHVCHAMHHVLHVEAHIVYPIAVFTLPPS